MLSIKRLLILLLPLALLTACDQAALPAAPPETGPPGQTAVQPSTAPGENGQADPEEDPNAWRIYIRDPDGAELWSFSEAGLERLSSDRVGAFSLVYSTINNWPTTRFYAARGYSIIDILTVAGLFETAQTVTFRSEDGYEANLTREQLLSPRYFYPHVGESDIGAEPVLPIIAYNWRDGTDDLSEIREDKPLLIFGQRNAFEQTNPAFVVGVFEIVVDTAPSVVWPAAGTFPQPGPVAADEPVKLQHASFGLVKLHYTLDGSDPTPLSKVYNPSTFRPEMTVPIPVTEPVTIKVLVTGFGKNDSEIATFEFWPAG